MRITDFDVYKDLLKEKSGLVLSADKSYLLDSRLGPIVKKWGFDSLDAMTASLQGVPDAKLVNDIVEAMTTNETSFFRDTKPFELLKSFVLPNLIEQRKTRKKINIWCAASSSGQEPYSLAMLLKDNAFSQLASWKMNILATDISHDILEQAKNGLYSQFEVQRGLDINTLVANFTQCDQKWQINKDIRDMIKFEYFNLLDSMAGLGTFDIIMCRNVLIYFDEETKGQVLDRMAKQLEPDGYLFLGGAETVLGLTDAFRPIPDKRGVYVRADAPDSTATANQAIA